MRAMYVSNAWFDLGGFHLECGLYGWDVCCLVELRKWYAMRKEQKKTSKSRERKEGLGGVVWGQRSNLWKEGKFVWV